MAPNPAQKQLNTLLEQFRQRRPLRAGSLIVTLFGDTVSQHGNTVWLGSVINALEPFGLNQRLVRTAVYRLMQDDWLSSVQVGRKSFYSFTETGLRHYQKAARRIYASEHSAQNGDWLFVFLNSAVGTSVSDAQKDRLRRELRWLGFGTLFPGVMAKPGAERQSLDETLRELQLQDQVVIMRSHPDDVASAEQLRDMVFRCWDLGQLEAQYQQMWEQFRPLYARLTEGDQLSAEEAFQLRTLLIHEYRRLLLKDAELPESMLPAAWVGRDVHNLTANLYRLIQTDAEQYVLASMETTSGKLPPASKGFLSRFGGM